MAHKRIHFFIPDELLAAMDHVAGKGKRNNLVVEILDHEIRRRRLLQILGDAAGGWKDADHPEMEHGSYAFVRGMRDESAKRLDAQAAHWAAPSE